MSDEENKEKNKVVDMNLFRLKKGLDQQAAQPHDPQADQKSPAGPQDTDIDPPFELFHDLLSIQAIAPQNMPVMMKNLLRSLNSQFALAAQKQSLPDHAGMYNAHIPVTNLNFQRAAIEEIAADFAQTLKRDKPRLHLRFKQRVYDEFDQLSANDRERALTLRFRTEAVRYTPAYKDLVRQLKAIFPTATFKPSIVELDSDSLRPCLQIDAPIIKGQDLRETITKYLADHKAAKNNL